MNEVQKYALLKSVGSLLDGTLDADGESQLARQLASDEDACELYRKFVAFDVELRWALSSSLQRDLLANLTARLDGDAPPSLSGVDWAISPAKPHVPVANSRFSRPMIWSIAGCAAGFVVYVALISWGMLDRDLDRDVVATGGTHVENQKSEIRNQQSEAAPVATIRDSVDAQWSRSTNKLEISNQKSEISQGEPLGIKSGLVELQLKQGVTLLIEGPADWSIDGNNNATLKRGKLVAKVPERAIGFTLETPAGKIVDLGTEFGVEVGVSGEVQVSVFRGIVETHPQRRGEQPLQLVAGQSARMAAATHRIEPVPFVESPFTQLRNYQSKASAPGEPVVVFADNFDTPETVAEISPTDANRSLRQSGVFRRGLSYIEWRSDNRPNTPQDDRTNLVAGAEGGRLRLVARRDAAVTVSPNANFRTHNPGGTRYVVEFDVCPVNFADGGEHPTSDSWAGVIVGCTSQGARMGSAEGIGLLIRRDRGYTVFDGTGGQVSVVASNPLPPEAVPANRTFHVRMEYQLARFDGPNPVEVRIDVNDVRIAQFTSRGALFENFIVLENHTADQPMSSEFDNFSITSQALPLPASKHNQQNVD